MKYYVSVTETLNRVVSVEADNESQAKDKVEAAYQCCELVLDSDDYVEDSAEITVENDQEYYRSVEEQGYSKYQHID